MATDIRHRRYTGMKQPWPNAARSLLKVGRERARKGGVCRRSVQLEDVMEKPIRIIEKNKAEEIRVSFEEFHGHQLPDHRVSRHELRPDIVRELDGDQFPRPPLYEVKP